MKIWLITISFIVIVFISCSNKDKSNSKFCNNFIKYGILATYSCCNDPNCVSARGYPDSNRCINYGLSVIVYDYYQCKSDSKSSSVILLDTSINNNGTTINQKSPNIVYSDVEQNIYFIKKSIAYCNDPEFIKENEYSDYKSCVSGESSMIEITISK